MASHRLTRAPKATLTRAALGATIAATAFAACPAQASSVPEAAPAQQRLAPPADAGKKSAEDRPKPTAAQLLALAKKQIGTSENAKGGGTKFQKWYMDSPRAAETIKRDGGDRQGYLNAAWCAMFVSWVGEEMGARSTVGWDAYTVTYARWFKNNSRWGAAPKPGAVVFFSWKGRKNLDAIQHVGFVIKDNGNGTITTVEGNTGNGKVEERTRPTSQVVGYGYPDYSA
ncbi:CHAP domain-containing protein [Nonomuraea typhae]|uniref:CHAP domain-containing protein n=1 Tax=Nonomuraea typhae TaxID=2603600 RepID=UPI0012F8AD84|nr:CHAP domain-containing protein [Nonomuraea typhae]